MSTFPQEEETCPLDPILPDAEAEASDPAAPTLAAPLKPKWDIVHRYTPLAKSIVYKMRIYFPCYMDYEDILSIGMLGLINASQKFDESKGRYFGKYAALRIKGALLDELRRLDMLPRLDRIRVKKYQAMIEELESTLKRQATDEEICQFMQINPAQLQSLRDKTRPLLHIPLDYTVPSDEDMPPCLHELVSDPTETNSRDRAEYRDNMAQVREHIQALPDVLKKVLTLYYVEGLNLSEIACVFNLTESRICQIHGRAISLLRQSICNN